MTALLLALALLAADSSQSNDPWERVRFLEGEWTGTAEGEPGLGTVHRTYQFVLNHRFLHERNVSAYAPRAEGQTGELHEHWSMISYDRQRQRLVLRQFHQEGFVNQYVLDEEASADGRLDFVSEALENLDNRWRALETYEAASENAFTETFELAPPGGAFSVYSKTSFTRVGGR